MSHFPGGSGSGSGNRGNYGNRREWFRNRGNRAEPTAANRLISLGFEQRFPVPPIGGRELGNRKGPGNNRGACVACERNTHLPAQSGPMRAGVRYPEHRAPGAFGAILAHLVSAPKQGGRLPIKPPGPRVTRSMLPSEPVILWGHATFGYVRVLPSVVRFVGPYLRGFRAFGACLPVSLWSMLAMRQTPNQADEVHTRQALLTSSLSHRRRGPGSAWGLPQQIRCDRG